MSEGLSDDGALTGRGSGLMRGLITGVATFLGGVLHTLPFLLPGVSAALTLAYFVVGVELIAISWIRYRFLQISFGNRSFRSSSVACSCCSLASSSAGPEP